MPYDPKEFLRFILGQAADATTVPMRPKDEMDAVAPGTPTWQPGSYAPTPAAPIDMNAFNNVEQTRGANRLAVTREALNAPPQRHLNMSGQDITYANQDPWTNGFFKTDQQRQNIINDRGGGSITGARTGEINPVQLAQQMAGIQERNRGAALNAPLPQQPQPYDLSPAQGGGMEGRLPGARPGDFSDAAYFSVRQPAPGPAGIFQNGVAMNPDGSRRQPIAQKKPFDLYGYL